MSAGRSPKSKLLTEDSGHGSWKTLAPVLQNVRRQSRTKAVTIMRRTGLSRANCAPMPPQLTTVHLAFTADAKVAAGTGLTPSASANSWQKWMQLWPGNCDAL